MRLTEQYYMLTKCGLTPVRGKKYTEDYAITYNHEKKLYNVTHIKSGTCISKDGFRRMKDCISEADNLIEIAEKFILENPDRITCCKCGCIFEFGQSDVKKITKLHQEDVGIILPIYRTVKYHITYVECPTCGHQHEISVRSSY